MNWATYTSEMRALFFSKNSVVKPHNEIIFSKYAFFLLLCVQVNIVPIIAKADTIAKSELKQFKEKVSLWVTENSMYMHIHLI